MGMAKARRSGRRCGGTAKSTVTSGTESDTTMVSCYGTASSSQRTLERSTCDMMLSKNGFAT